MSPNKYFIEYTQEFIESYRKLSKESNEVKSIVKTAIVTLSVNPFHETLRTHKVNIPGYGYRYSSRVTNDIRIGWDFVEGKTVLLSVG